MLRFHAATMAPTGSASGEDPARICKRTWSRFDRDRRIETMLEHDYNDEDVTPTPNQVDDIASLLESEHGALAADVAEFFSTKHSIAGDAGRCWAWAGVADRVRMRAHQRLRGAPQ